MTTTLSSSYTISAGSSLFRMREKTVVEGLLLAAILVRLTSSCLLNDLYLTRLVDEQYETILDVLLNAMYHQHVTASACVLGKFESAFFRVKLFTFRLTCGCGRSLRI